MCTDLPLFIFCCCNNIPEAEVFIKKRNLFLTILEVGKSESVALALIRAFLLPCNMMEASFNESEQHTNWARSLTKALITS